jgi:Putative DNA-binding domain
MNPVSIAFKMPLSHKPLSNLDLADLQTLVDGGVRESREIEYKRQLPGNSDEDKREFLADVSSFANASGGDIMYGIEADAGLPTGIVGVEGNADAELLRLESIIRAGIQPRVMGLHIQPVPLSDGRHVLILRIPASWTSPHMVTFKNLSRFYSRTSAGKYQLDVTELRSLFARDGNTAERIRRFRDERLARIVAGEAAFELTGSALTVVHLVPLRAFDPASQIDLRAIKVGTPDLSPLGWRGGSMRWNVDGYATFMDLTATGSGVPSYVQLFRHGAVEAVDARILELRPPHNAIPGTWLAKDLVEAIPRFLAAQREVGVELPVAVLVTLVGIKGRRLAGSESWSSMGGGHPVDRDLVQAADIIIDDWQTDMGTALRPALDSVWNAAGWRQCSYYDESGKLRLPGR